MKRAREDLAVMSERPKWLPEHWKLEVRTRSSGASAGSMDRYYVEPVSGRRFRSKNEVLHFLETGSARKKKLNLNADDAPSDSTGGAGQQPGPRMTLPGFDFDFNNPPQKVTWTGTYDNVWTPSIDGVPVPESTRQEWAAVFSYLAQLGNKNGASKPPK